MNRPPAYGKRNVLFIVFYGAPSMNAAVFLFRNGRCSVSSAS
jgi:hypothetical protein